MQQGDEWTIERWKTKPRLIALEFPESTIEPATPLWKDLTLAALVAALLWGAALIVFG